MNSRRERLHLESLEARRVLSGVSFAAREILGGASDITAIIAADLNGDRLLDLVTASQSHRSVSWYRNLGAGFAPPQTLIDNVHADQLSAGDADGDGDTDLLLASAADGLIAWHLLDSNDVMGGINVRVVDRSQAVSSIALADVDHDGDVDVVASYGRSSDGARTGVFWHENDGQGVFGPTYGISSMPTRSLQLSSTDRDRQLDILAVYDVADDTALIGWITSLSLDGTAWNETKVQQGVKGSRSTVLVDIDLDGDSDAVTVDSQANRAYWQESTSSQVAIDAPRQAIGMGNDMTSLATGDLDRDGFVDLIVGSRHQPAPLRWFGNDRYQEHFHESTVVEAYTQLDHLLIADLDRDRDLDIATVVSGGAGIVWYEQRPVGDANNDGRFDSVDLIQVLTANEYEDSQARNSTYESGDWTGDGEFTSADFVHAFSIGVYAHSDHPRLLFGPEDVPRIRQNLVHGTYADKFAQEKQYALDRLNKDYSDPQLHERRKSVEAMRIAFVALMLDTSDPDRAPIAAKAREILAHINDGLWPGTSIIPEHHATWEINELHQWYAGSTLMEYSLAYDFLVGAGELNGVDRIDARMRILRLAQIEHTIHSTPVTELDQSIYYLRNANKRFRSLSGVGVVALTFPEQTGAISDPFGRLPESAEPFDTSAALDFVMGELFRKITINARSNPTSESMVDHYISRDGVYRESFTYQIDAFGVFIPFVYSYYRATGIDYISGSDAYDDRIIKVLENNVRVMMPNERLPLIGDAWDGKWYRHHDLIAAHAEKPELHQWYFDNVLDRWTEYLPVAAVGLAADWAPAPDPQFRTEFLQDAGLAVFRDQFGPDATYMMLVAREHPVRGHNQADQASFLLYAHGAQMVVDPGYGAGYLSEPGIDKRAPGGKSSWIKSGLAHSGITVDSVYSVSEAPAEDLRKAIHPRVTIHSYTKMLDPARLRNTLAARDIDYAEAHVTYEEKDAELTRAVVFPRHRYFILEDNLRATADHQYGWQLHLGDSSKGTLTSEGNTYQWVTPNRYGEDVGLGIHLLAGDRQVDVHRDGPTNLFGYDYPDDVFDHTYIIAHERAKDTRFVTLLDPHRLDETLTVETIVPGKAWKVVHSANEYDLIMSQDAAQTMSVGQITTDAAFVVASIDRVDGVEVVRSILARGGRGVSVGYDLGQSFAIPNDQMWHFERP